MEQQIVKAGNGSAIQRQEFGATELQVVRETAATAVAAREKAAIEARYIMAMQRPRNIEYARQQLLKACDNKDFAESSWYKIPNKGEGFTIRFAEEALRCFGNVFPETMTVYESEQIRMLRVTVTDLESNLSYSSEVILQKTVERQFLKPGQAALSKRQNSQGKDVFLVEATEDEVRSKQNSLRSMAIRADGLRLIPSWLKDEAKRRIFSTIKAEVKADIDAEKRKLIDSFGEHGIRVPDLEQYLGHPIENLSPKEVVEFRTLYVALANQEASWAEILEMRQAPAEAEGSKEPAVRMYADATRKIAEEKLKTPSADESQPGPLPEPGQARGFNFGAKK